MAQITKILALTAVLMLAIPTAAAPAPIRARQLAGEGNACSSLLSSTDNGVGYGVENAEDNTASLVSGGKLGRRQGDKIANGAATLLNAAGQPAAADLVKTNGDSVDGQLTDGATNLGAQLGGEEEATLEQVGATVP